MTAHASLGASSAHRWMNCPGSPRQIAETPKHLLSPSSSYAEEGTCAHALGERCLKKNLLTPDSFKGQFISPDGEEFSKKGRPHWYEVTDDMTDAVQIYIDVVIEELHRAGGELMIEKSFKLNSEMWGTNDASIWNPITGELVVIDYKHGMGHAVEVACNPQLLFYALGAMKAVGGAVEKVTLIIVQPRAPHAAGPVRRWSPSAGELEGFKKDLKTAAKMTKDPTAKLVPGQDQCRFCDAAGSCPAVKEESLAQAQRDFADLIDMPTALEVRTPEQSITLGLQISEALKHVDMVEKWAKSVRVAALQALEHDRRAIPGYKLVRGKRGNRAWRDQEAVIDYLSGLDLDPNQYMSKPKLLTPTKVEKLAADIKTWVKTQVEQKDGKPHVALESDKRDEIPPSFDDIVGDENGDAGW